MKDKLKRISEISDYRFAEIKDGITHHLISGEVIPDNLINKTNRMKKLGTPRPDGFYRISEATCDGGGEAQDCSIGSPSPRCLENFCYSENKCAVYYFNDYRGGFLSVGQCLDLMED